MSEVQISSIRGPAQFRLTPIAIILGLLQMFSANMVFACDIDAECGIGGTCIKREKRARGVCYGGQQKPIAENLEGIERSPRPAPARPEENPHSAFQTNDDLPIYGEEGYVEPEPIAASRIIDRLDVPERTESTCVTSTDCAGGQECVYRDPMLGHGECEAPPMPK